ncbi:hypothetical protein AOLI_G00199290 [Acnodon oligacanthus]
MLWITLETMLTAVILMVICSTSDLSEHLRQRGVHLHIWKCRGTHLFSLTNTIKCHPIRIRQIDKLAGVICSEFLAHPTISVSTPIRVYRSLQGPEVFRGYSFTITCSTQPQHPGGSFHLKLPWNNRSDSQAAVSHSASFLFPAADDSHRGNYSCVYENQVIFQTEVCQHKNQSRSNSWFPGPFVYNFSSESEPLPLTITDFSWTPFITRMLLVPFLMLITCSFIFLLFNKCGHFFIRDAGECLNYQDGTTSATLNINSLMPQGRREPHSSYLTDLHWMVVVSQPSDVPSQP